MSAGADGGAMNAHHELNEADAGLARILAACTRLQAHGELSHLSQSVAGMLAEDVAMAARRVAWLRAAMERKGAA